MIKTQIFMNKSVYLGVPIARELSKEREKSRAVIYEYFCMNIINN